MYEAGNRRGRLKTGAGSLVVAGICLVLNVMIGPTILANVLLVMVAFFSTLSAFFTALVAVFRARPLDRPYGVLVTSVVFMSIIIWLVASDGVPAGYGP